MFALALLAAQFSTAPAPLPASGTVVFEGHRIKHRRATGVADRSAARLARIADPVRVASVSKLAVAMAAMRLVEARRLDLDRDVSGYLGWRLRNPAAPDAPVTLRQLLSHTAGIRDDAGYALALDDDLEAYLRKPGAWDTAHTGKRWFHYANLNFPIVAAVLEGASGERFDRLMTRLVFKPLGVDACFNWVGCSNGQIASAVVLYRETGEVARDNLRGVRPVCPGTLAHDGTCDVSTYRLAHNGAFFSPQGGMRISMVDLAKLGMALNGKVNFLSPASRAAMTTPQWRFDGSNGDTENGFYCGYGLGVMLLALPGRPAACRDDPFGDGRPRIGHAGEAYGLRAGVWVDPASGRGIAFYTSAVPDDAPTGPNSAFTAAEEAIITQN